MATYSLRCCNSSCRHRRVSTVHPLDAKKRYRCPSCLGYHGWRIENRDYNKRNLCHCAGVALIDGRSFPHKTTHPLCEQHPQGLVNQARRMGVPDAYMMGFRSRRFMDKAKSLHSNPYGCGGIAPEIDLMNAGRVMRPDEDCPF